MPTIRCPTRTTCPPGFPGSLAISADNPISNFSSLDPDQNRFVSIIYPEPPVGPVTFYAYGCIGVCYGATQVEADACAAAQQASCYVTYLNTAQTCVKVCADGSQQAFTTDAGKFQAESQAQADQLAYNWACQWVDFYCNGGDPGTDTGGTGNQCVGDECVDTGDTIPDPGGGDDGGGGTGPGDGGGGGGGTGPGGGGGGGGTEPPIIPPIPPVNNVPNTEQRCTVSCSAVGTRTAVVPAGWTLLDSQEAADAYALAHACQLAFSGPCLSGFSKVKLCRDIDIGSMSISVTPPANDPNVTYVFEISGALPPGLTWGQIDSDSISFSGIPVTSGTYPIIIKATGTNGLILESHYTLKVAGWDDSQSAVLSAAQTCYSYITQVLVDDGPYTTPLHFTVVAGVLPDGLVLDETTGYITGTPTTLGPFNFTIQVEDSA